MYFLFSFSESSLMASGSIKTPLQLYRHLMKLCNTLPRAPRNHYKHYIRQQFKSHSDETDVNRVQEIIQRSVEDAEWILKKYKRD